MSEQLSESLEDYLEAIQELLLSTSKARTKDIAQRLQVKMPSVTVALRQLSQRGLISYEQHKPITLTAAGQEIARRVSQRHSTLKQFFTDILGLPLDQASNTACRLEHVVDADAVRRFNIVTSAITRRSDAAPLRAFLSEAYALLQENPDLITLDAMEPGQTGVICRAGRNLDASPLPLGTTILVQGYSLDHTAIRVTHNGNITEIPLSTAENLWLQIKQ